MLFSEVQPECKEVQCTVYFGKCTLAKCLLLQELLSAKVHSVHSVKCTVPSSLPKCAVHSAHLHSTQRTVHYAKYKVHSVQQLNCDASTAVAASDVLSCIASSLRCILFSILSTVGEGVILSAELSRVEKKHNFVIIFTPIYNTLIFTEILTQLKVWTAEILQQSLASDELSCN